ncbi:MAG: carbohydrate ABC transporter permease [Treponema sp.]|jgi:putative aldouronate transport system permease protein|nr:carbohydrate ABC transporter permease [Treponema sp.]
MKSSIGRRVFIAGNTVFISLLAIICIIPIWTMFCYSISSSAAVSSKLVSFWPVDMSSAAYQRVMQNSRFWQSILMTGRRILFGVPLSMLLIVLAAYPLSKPETIFRARRIYVRIFIFAMLFSGGLIPGYIVIIKLGLIDTLGALILPGAVPIFNVILMMNFFRSIPTEIEDAALIDGASQWRVLRMIILPLSAPVLATVCLFVLLGHWNSWFDGLIYMNSPEKYPLQSYLQTIISDPTKMLQTMNLEELRLRMKVNNETLRAAQIFISMIPVLCVYPFMQRYFTAGIVMGSVKG